MAKKPISENIEEYLETLYRQSCLTDHVSTNTLAKELGVAPGSVTQMLKKLEGLGYINYIPYKGARLTKEGSKIAQKITRKHRILELFLKNDLKIKPENVHEQACEMEHSLSDEAERALCQRLHQPDVCPEGSLIPACDYDFENCEDCMDYDSDIDNKQLRKYNLLSLTQIREGKGGIVSFIRGNNYHSEKLQKLNIDIGTYIEIIERDKSKDFLIITIDGKENPIERDLANNIFLNTNVNL